MKTVVQTLARILPRSTFARGVVLISGGTAFGQGLVILTSPLLTRLYAPSDFGIWAVFTSIVTILAVMSAFRYELAIPLPEADSDAAHLVLFALATVVGMSVLAGLLLLVLGDLPERWTGAQGLGAHLWLVPPTLLAMGAYQVLNYWTTRKKRFSVLSATRVMQASAQVAIQIGAGLLRFGAVGLIVGWAASRLVGVGSLARRAHLPETVVALDKWKELAKAYRKFPLFTVWASLTNVVGVHVPLVLIARFFALDTAGFFALTMRVLSIPSALVAQAVAQVFYPAAAERRREGQAAELVERVATILLVISIIIFAFVGLHGRSLFSYAFGADWETAGLYAQFLAPWFVVSFVSSPISSYVLVTGKQRQAFLMSLYETGLRLSAIWVGAHYASVDLAVALFAAVGIFISIVYIQWVLKLAGTSILLWLRQVRRFVVVSVLLVVVLVVAGRPLNSISPLLSMAVSAVGLGALGLWSWHRLSRKVVRVVEQA